MMETRGLLTAGLITGLLLAAPCLAHEQSVSYVTIIVAPGDSGRTETVETEIAFRPSAAVKGLGLDVNQNGRIDDAEISAGAPAALLYLSEHVSLSADYTALSLQPVDAARRQDEEGRDMIAFRLSTPLDKLPAELAVQIDFSDRLGGEHLNLVKVISNTGGTDQAGPTGERVQQAVLAPDEPGTRFPVGGKMPFFAQIGTFVWLGVEHIFLGYDHIMFLLALILLGGRMKNLVKIVTAFTVAHSLTLILAALGVVALPPRLIEAGIALSIAYVAAENFWLREANHRWMLTFFFGLVHGFGFANVLRDLGLPSRGLIASLLSFNVGVELGQICIVAILFPVILWLSKRTFQRKVVLVFSGIIFLFGAGWFIERSLGLGFMPF